MFLGMFRQVNTYPLSDNLLGCHVVRLFPSYCSSFINCHQSFNWAVRAVLEKVRNANKGSAFMVDSMGNCGQAKTYLRYLKHSAVRSRMKLGTETTCGMLKGCQFWPILATLIFLLEKTSPPSPLKEVTYSWQGRFTRATPSVN